MCSPGAGSPSASRERGEPRLRSTVPGIGRGVTASAIGARSLIGRDAFGVRPAGTVSMAAAEATSATTYANPSGRRRRPSTLPRTIER